MGLSWVIYRWPRPHTVCCTRFQTNFLTVTVTMSKVIPRRSCNRAERLNCTATLANKRFVDRHWTQYARSDRPIDNVGCVAGKYASAWYSIRTTRLFNAATIAVPDGRYGASSVSAATESTARRVCDSKQTGILIVKK